MAKVFTISPGLENMGGLKTGGQGSVYKGKRLGEIITAIKILPTPIFRESAEDANYTAFQNEVSKLKKVNETPNPNVVKILSSGISDTGNFPFIEMEYVEGPDLEELLKQPNDPLFTIKETLKVAEQLSNAIAHCHRMEVRHGDIKSNNIKFNSATGNYILLDFGLAIMSDEQRRRSLKEAGAIEFMAPEQNTGQMLFQTDVYSFGVILFELLTGTVPFTLQGRGESARNEVRLAHMALPVPDLIELRRLALPSNWSNQQKEREMQVPERLVSLVYKCLEKKPEKRFPNGEELHHYIIRKLFSEPISIVPPGNVTDQKQAIKKLIFNHGELKKQLVLYQQELHEKEGELLTLKQLLKEKESSLQLLKSTPEKSAQVALHRKGVSISSFAALLLVAFVLAAFSMFPGFTNKLLTIAKATNDPLKKSTSIESKSNENTVPITSEENKISEKQRQEERAVEDETMDEGDLHVDQQGNAIGEQEKVPGQPEEAPTKEKAAQQKNEISEEATTPGNIPVDDESKHPEMASEENNDIPGSTKNGVLKKYLVVSKAYFYNEPDENTKRNEFISSFEHAIVQAVNERYGFIYVIITNPAGQVFKGWLRKKDLKLYSVE